MVVPTADEAESLIALILRSLGLVILPIVLFTFFFVILSSSFKIRIMTSRVLTLRVWSLIMGFSKIDYSLKLIFLHLSMSKLVFYPDGLKDRLRVRND